MTSAAKKDDSKAATENSVVEAEADITISRRTFIKVDAIKKNEVEAESDVTISRRTFIKIDAFKKNEVEADSDVIVLRRTPIVRNLMALRTKSKKLRNVP